MSGTMRAWTRQHEGILDILERDGTFRTNEGFIRKKNMEITDYYLDLYRWYAAEASKRVPRPDGAEYPIWLFLKKEERLPPIAGTVVLELEVPSERVVVTDTERWGYRVNYMYIPTDADDEKSHEAELKRLGIANETALIQTSKGNFYPLIKRKIIASWPRVFDEPAPNAVVQGTIWEIKREWIRDIARCTDDAPLD